MANKNPFAFFISSVFFISFVFFVIWPIFLTPSSWAQAEEGATKVLDEDKSDNGEEEVMETLDKDSNVNGDSFTETTDTSSGIDDEDSTEAADMEEEPDDEAEEELAGEEPDDEAEEELAGEEPDDEAEEELAGEEPDDEAEEELAGEEPDDEAEEELAGTPDLSEESEAKGVAQKTPPSDIKKRGVYKIYHPNAKYGLTRITKDGVYEYKTPSSPQSHSISVRLGMFSPSYLENPKTGSGFADLYTDPAPMILFDYEWDPKYTGPLEVKAGSGLFIAQGHGTFADSNSDLTPQESFTFLAFPSSLSVIYKAQYWKNQFFVPYVDGGMDLLPFVELRDDGKGTKLGASLAGHVAFGASISLGFLDRTSLIQLDREYGINSIWLTGELRTLTSLSGDLDFSGHIINVGFTARF